MALASGAKVVVLGGGFGGIEAAKGLGGAAVEVTLIDRRNFHLFQPLLYQVATGGLSPGDIAWPLRGMLRRHRNVRVRLGEAAGIDVPGRRVLLAQGEAAYDVLVVATGAGDSYFGNQGWERCAPGLKTIEQAAEIRRRILLAFEAAELEPDAERRRSWLTFAIIGAGPTGVELAGTLGELSRDTLRGDFRRIDPAEARIFLLDMAPRVLPQFPEDLSAKAESSLIRLGVRARCGVRVIGVDSESVEMEGPRGVERIPARTVIWAAGVQASPLGGILAAQTGAEADRSGRLRVESDCTLAGHPEIFVIGDLADYRGREGRSLPGLAPVAMQQGRYVARAIRRRLRGEASPPFRYTDKGTLATIGRNHAVAVFGRLHVHGRLAWLLWLFVHLLYLAGTQSRILVAIQWAFHFFTYNRNARLILGGP
ncbi:MAG TPA: NAD(P)/FAD-dependent oxidoreductase, partial [Bryobacteraceae bacterium]|nr:NAD(P)/FAD-dependent oxidoreductase [Bryobacteraceae bacterium]